MNTSPTIETQQQKEVYRINIFYTGIYNKKAGGCMFINAVSKEDATKAAVDELVKLLIEDGYPKDCFKLEVSRSCLTEVEIYKQNKFNKSYSSLVN